MAEYIEKAELIKKLCFETAEWYYSPTIKTIKEFPSADVQPVKYSSWEYRTYPIVDRDGVARRCMTGYVCKACGHGEPEEKRFCGGCGADMRGDENGAKT